MLCEADGYSFKHAAIYIEIVNFVSITFVLLGPSCTRKSATDPQHSIALYGLLVFYGLMKEELVRRRPMAKFLSIKLIVMFTFYQTFVVSLMSCEGLLSLKEGHIVWVA